MQVGWDVDNLKVLTCGGLVSQTCCVHYCAYDNCCFLNPSAPAWDSGTGYSLGDEVSSTGYVYKSLRNGNTNHAVSDTAWWQRSTVQPCGNTSWNAYPPYGGIGKTPKYYLVTRTGINKCPSGTYGDISFTLTNLSGFQWHYADSNYQIDFSPKYTDAAGPLAYLDVHRGSDPYYQRMFWGHPNPAQCFMNGSITNTSKYVMCMMDMAGGDGSCTLKIGG